MTLYEYRCQDCGHRVLSDECADEICTVCCGARGQRIWSFSNATIMHEHMNTTLGEPVSSMRQFKDGLKRKSEEATARTGIPHNFQPIDPTDKKALGVTDEGIKI